MWTVAKKSNKTKPEPKAARAARSMPPTFFMGVNPLYLHLTDCFPGSNTGTEHSVRVNEEACDELKARFEASPALKAAFEAEDSVGQDPLRAL